MNVRRWSAGRHCLHRHRAARQRHRQSRHDRLCLRRPRPPDPHEPARRQLGWLYLRCGQQPHQHHGAGWRDELRLRPRRTHGDGHRPRRRNHPLCLRRRQPPDRSTAPERRPHPHHLRPARPRDPHRAGFTGEPGCSGKLHRRPTDCAPATPTTRSTVCCRRRTARERLATLTTDAAT